MEWADPNVCADADQQEEPQRGGVGRLHVRVRGLRGHEGLLPRVLEVRFW